MFGFLSALCLMSAMVADFAGNRDNAILFILIGILLAVWENTSHIVEKRK